MNANRPILVATKNPGKLAEVRAILGALDVQCVGLDGLADLAEPVEDGATFEANAAIKAMYYSRATGLWALADDSGLEVDALNGAPGVRSARFAGGPRNDQANNRKLVARLQGVPPERRTARFRCAVALADGDRLLATAEGIIEGRIIDEPRGSNGFGYDPHFLVPELGITTAQMPPEQKNRLSHRGRALQAIADRLLTLLASSGGESAAPP